MRVKTSPEVRQELPSRSVVVLGDCPRRRRVDFCKGVDESALDYLRIILHRATQLGVEGVIELDQAS